MTDYSRDLALALQHALEALKRANPKNLERSLDFAAEQHDVVLPDDAVGTILTHIESCGPNDRLLHDITIAVQYWDHVDAEWTGDTTAYTDERRKLILERLGLSAEQQSVVNKRVLMLSENDLPIVIANEHAPWYPQRRKTIAPFYWPHYVSQLLEPKGSWNPLAISQLEASVDDVVSRLSDPSLSEIYPAKGLVVGYVQSGKTAHFSGLIAKAADAGYRFVIVLAGTLDILRRQTQRRIDKDIVGRELLGSQEYGSDAEWGRFVEHGGTPSLIGAFDWERLTNRDDDYTALKRYLVPLNFKQVDRSKPFNHPDNLRQAPARLAVIKKVPARLEKICDDLESLKDLRAKLEHVPTLIIDDESDQASINTINPEMATTEKSRTSTNALIVRLLSLLPRAQYVGYTATPYANVFVDPDDVADLFPKDFIVSLPRPIEYMGVSDFYDFGEEFAEDDSRSNKRAHVREVVGSDTEANNLPKALDAFVLAGALKLFRQHIDPQQYRFRHHTMLIHHSSSQSVHEADRDLVASLFARGARYQRAQGLAALRDLFDTDFKPISAIRDKEAPFPDSFDKLKPFISSCLSKICAGEPVRIVNGDEKKKDQTPDFDQEDVWAVLVGGTKLSRGYTVEGLTVSYYRRPAGAGDTLMQMGRWFGFRQGYRDLVRLFIGTAEKRGKSVVNLYDAFGAICRDEEALRADLKKYSKNGLLPKRVPPLVHQHMDRLPPTARNKMFNAVIAEQDFAGEWTEKTQASANSKVQRAMISLADELLAAGTFRGKVDVTSKSAKGGRAPRNSSTGTYLITASGADVLSFLSKYKWSVPKNPIAHELKYIGDSLRVGRLQKWVVMLPQPASGPFVELKSEIVDKIFAISRTRAGESRFNVYSEQSQRVLASAIAGIDEVGGFNGLPSDLNGAGLPVLVLYFVRELNNPQAETSVGFALKYPGVRKQLSLTWTVRPSVSDEAANSKNPGMRKSK